MFLELSRPAGDVSRWEKVLKRLTLLNKYYPLKSLIDCHNMDFQRKVETIDSSEGEKMYSVVRESFIEQGVVFFGGYAMSLYTKYMEKGKRQLMNKIPDFDVLSENPDRSALIIKEKLEENGFTHVAIVSHNNIDDVIPKHIQITVGKEIVAFIFEPVACHNYNTIKIDNYEINVATIDTMLSFYLAFIYTNKPYFDKDRILCMAQFLFEVEEKNRLEQKGLLKRFSINCYGKQATIESMRAEKAEKFKQLVNNRNSREWNELFFKYNPGTSTDTNTNTNTNTNASSKQFKKYKKYRNSKYKKWSDNENIQTNLTKRFKKKKKPKRNTKRFRLQRFFDI